jgi:hypothetical protein
MSHNIDDLALILNAAENWLQSEDHSKECLHDYVLSMESRDTADAIRRIRASLNPGDADR